PIYLLHPSLRSRSHLFVLSRNDQITTYNLVFINLILYLFTGSKIPSFRCFIYLLPDTVTKVFCIILSKSYAYYGVDESFHRLFILSDFPFWDFVGTLFHFV